MKKPRNAGHRHLIGNRYICVTGARPGACISVYRTARDCLAASAAASLQALLGQAGEVGLGAKDSDCQQDARLGRRKRTAQELAQLASDVAEAMKRLPPELRDLAGLLMSTNLSEAARTLGIPRTTANDMVRRIRIRFENAGLKNYLENFPSPRL